MLHIVSTASALNSCLAVIQNNDVVLLIEDGVIAAIQSPIYSNQIYALKPDIEARGLLDKIASHIQLIDYSTFVDLTAQHHPIQTWK